MCGIANLYYTETQLVGVHLHHMASALSHREADGDGYYRWTALLAHLSYPVCKIFADILQSLIPAQPYWSRRLDFLRTTACVRDKGENASQASPHYWQERLFQPAFQESLTHSEVAEQYQLSQLYDEAASEHPMERWLEVDQRMYLASDLLAKVDIASMAASLECRAPMLDHRLAEIANRMYRTDKIRAGQTKYAFGRLAARRIPREIMTFLKKGFTLPIAGWLRTELADWTEAKLFKEEMSWQPFLRPAEVHALWQEHQQGQVDHTLRLWTLIAWELWHRTACRPLDRSWA